MMQLQEIFIIDNCTYIHRCFFVGGATDAVSRSVPRQVTHLHVKAPIDCHGVERLFTTGSANSSHRHKPITSTVAGGCAAVSMCRNPHADSILRQERRIIGRNWRPSSVAIDLLIGFVISTQVTLSCTQGLAFASAVRHQTDGWWYRLARTSLDRTAAIRPALSLDAC
jgi:hypothetical protein